MALDKYACEGSLPNSCEAAPKHPFPATASPAALATEHGRPPDDDDLELEIDESMDGEESIFGEVPTQHSRPPK